MEKITWKRNYGDNQETDDTVLWVNGKPTNNVISPFGGLYFVYINDKQVGAYGTRKEAKERILYGN